MGDNSFTFLWIASGCSSRRSQWWGHTHGLRAQLAGWTWLVADDDGYHSRDDPSGGFPRLYAPPRRGPTRRWRSLSVGPTWLAVGDHERRPRWLLTMFTRAAGYWDGDRPVAGALSRQYRRRRWQTTTCRAPAVWRSTWTNDGADTSSHWSRHIVWEQTPTCRSLRRSDCPEDGIDTTAHRDQPSRVRRRSHLP